MKVSFDGANQLIIEEYVVDGTANIIDVKTDIYSAWKLWVQEQNNAKFLSALRVIGGDQIGTGVYLGSTFFLVNDWKFRPCESTHTIVLNGNIYTDDGSEIWIPTIGIYNVVIKQKVSNIVDLIVTQGGAATDAIADAVWNKNLSAISSSNSAGVSVSTIQQIVDDNQALILGT